MQEEFERTLGKIDATAQSAAAALAAADAELRKSLAAMDADLRAEVGLRGRMSIELDFRPNFERLALGCIDADFCK